MRLMDPISKAITFTDSDTNI